MRTYRGQLRARVAGSTSAHSPIPAARSRNTAFSTARAPRIAYGTESASPVSKSSSNVSRRANRISTSASTTRLPIAAAGPATTMPKLGFSRPRT
ncbi:hypothetical protein LUW74_01000 [Actinomadura madurae]|uniref:hypothetical protein n=1 Tax=Actinomadura madurae TaxID=1993 RepID=UPI0020276583|nr:hypothetical protein [Actinomadura madurae]URN02098.1 hypothetical protein LUW74_01000 [Actinomadura madurae]